MARRFSQFCVNILLLSMFLQTSEIRCLRRLPRRKLSAEADDIRTILSSTLDANPSQIIENNKKRDTSNQGSETEDTDASQWKSSSLYDDDVDEDYSDQQHDFGNTVHKRSVESDPSAEKSDNQADADAYEETDLDEVNDVAKRNAKNEDDYNQYINANALVSSDNNVDELKSSSITAKNVDNVEKKDNRREANAEEVKSELEFEKQIEDQIQQRIDSIKEDIKREIERKQQIREIEANNAKYDELELDREDDDLENQQIVDSESLDSSIRSNFPDKVMLNDVEKVDQPVRSKRSDTKVDNGRVNEDRDSDESMKSISRNARSINGLEKSSHESEFRSKKSDLNQNDKNKENKESALVLPVKKRSFEKRMILVEKSNLRGGKRKDRSSILIPERGHAEVKDELPEDLILGSNLRIARSDPANVTTMQVSRSARSVVHHEEQPKRYRRDMEDEVENEEGTMQDNFLFEAQEKPKCRTRRRRKKLRKHPHHSRKHRAIRESSMDDEEEIDEERDKRAMPMDEDIALEYKESFGGLQPDNGGALGRFKRIRRSSNIS